MAPAFIAGGDASLTALPLTRLAYILSFFRSDTSLKGLKTSHIFTYEHYKKAVRFLDWNKTFVFISEKLICFTFGGRIALRCQLREVA